MSLLDRVARAYGIEPAYTDDQGTRRPTSPETKRALLRAMNVDAVSEAGLRVGIGALRRSGPLPSVLPLSAGADAAIPLHRGAKPFAWRLALENGETLEGHGGQDDTLLLPAPLPEGYHRLEAEDGSACLLIAAPERCWLPSDLGIDRGFGLGCQVYGLRSKARDLGSGDFADLRSLAEEASRAGADFFALSPLHALFFARPEVCSPYSPSSRLFLNWLLIAPAGSGDAPPAPSDLVDYPGTARERRRLLEAVFAGFDPADADFTAFRAHAGEALERHATFEALHEHFAAKPWQDWPMSYQNLASAEVVAFARQHAARITFFVWLQWLADRQLADVQATAKAAGMRIGLYRDLAVGVDPSGSLAWSLPGVAVRGASIGAPPDDFSPAGQDWGIAPLDPQALARVGFAPFIADLRANMRHAGMLRVDHVMGIARLFWIPPGGQGAYVRYPFETMLAILKLESRRHRCVVVGEDLGTIPRGFRPRLQRAGIHSSRILYFERDKAGGFKPPGRYPKLALASANTHDVAPLKGWLEGGDIAWRERLGIFDAKAAKAARAERARDREQLVAALRRARLLQAEDDEEAIAVAACRWLARTPSSLLLLQLEDLVGAVEQPNLPGVTEGHPNWRRRLGNPVEDMTSMPFAQRLLAAITAERARA